ncbi:hypothetical protein [Streptomyces bauhiniae]|uniref:hypothetical protein n=1 Tax=Streptomyces TaxID=1883 RepID=UPI00365E8B68
MMPSITHPDSMQLDRIKNLVAEVLKTCREVEEWRNDYDPASQEWYTLINLARTAESLVLSLPVEMLPEAEWRWVSTSEYAAVDEILDALKEAGK